MELKDCIHFYLGCEVETPDGIGWLGSVNRDRRKMDGLLLDNRVSVHFKTIRLTKNSVDAPSKKRNYGDYLITPEVLIPIQSNDTSDRIDLPGGIKPFLRPISDMTEEEADEVGNLDYDFRGDPAVKPIKGEDLLPLLTPNQFIWLTQRSFDIFELIKEGLALNKSHIKQ